LLNNKLDLFECVFKTCVYPAIVINTSGIIQHYNAAAEKLFQYTAKEMLGENIKKLMPSQVSKAHDGYLKRYQETHERHIIGSARSLQGNPPRK
jgi:two-component system, LuxR family, sensor kinase FixL